MPALLPLRTPDKRALLVVRYQAACVPRLNLWRLIDLCVSEPGLSHSHNKPLGPVEILTEAEKRERGNEENEFPFSFFFSFFLFFFLFVHSVVSPATLSGCGGSCGWCELVTAQTSTNLTGNMQASATENKWRGGVGKEHRTSQTPSNKNLKPK